MAVIDAEQDLNNPCYTGRGVAYKWRDIKRPGRAPKLVRRPAEEHIPLPEGTIPAIIDQALFDRVQQKMQRNKEMATRNNRHADQALLRCGLVVCGNCGEVMHVQQLPAGPAYTCRKAAGKEKHTSPGIKVELLDAAAWRFVTESLKDQAMIERRVEAIKAAVYDGTQQELEPVEREIKRLAEEQANLALAIGNIDRTRPEHVHAIKSLTVLLEQSSAAMQRLEGERRTIIEQQENIAKLEAQLEKYKQDCIAIGKGLKEIHDYQGKRGILEFLGFKATVWEYRHDPRYKFELVPPVLRPQGEWDRDGDLEYVPGDLIYHGHSIAHQKQRRARYQGDREGRPYNIRLSLAVALVAGVLLLRHQVRKAARTFRSASIYTRTITQSTMLTK